MVGAGKDRGKKSEVVRRNLGHLNGLICGSCISGGHKKAGT